MLFNDFMFLAFRKQWDTKMLFFFLMYFHIVCILSLCFVQVRLPDVEFFVNLGDWPLEKRKLTEKIHPIFSWCGSNNTRDIVMPTYDLTESVLETMGRYG